MPTVLPQRCRQHCPHTHLDSERYLRYRCVKLSLSCDDCLGIDDITGQFKCYVMLFSWKCYTARPPPPLNTNRTPKFAPPRCVMYPLNGPTRLVGCTNLCMYVCCISTSVSSMCACVRACVRVACTVVSKQADPWLLNYIEFLTGNRFANMISMLRNKFCGILELVESVTTINTTE